MSAEQSLLDVKVLLSKHKENESVYKQKIKEINQTRNKISDQFELLQQTYDKKLKALENQLNNFRQQNDSLHKQNIIFKAEIQNYQSRLIEKEKIIAVLLGQKKDIVISSDRSKSEKTQSLNAHEEDNSNKVNKKINSKVKEQIDLSSKMKFTEEKQAQKAKTDSQTQKKLGRETAEAQIKEKNDDSEKLIVKGQHRDMHEEIGKKSRQKVNIVKTREQQQNTSNFVERITLTQKKSRDQNHDNQDDLVVFETANPRNKKAPKNRSPPPPPIKKKKAPKPYKQLQYYEQQEGNQVQQRDSMMDNKQNEVIKSKQKIVDPQYGLIQVAQKEDQVIYQVQRHVVRVQQASVKSQQEYQKEDEQQFFQRQVEPQFQPQQDILAHFQQDENLDNQDHLLSHFSTHPNPYQAENQESSQINLLSHFTKSIQQIATQPYPIKVFNRNKKKKKTNELEESINTSNIVNKSNLSIHTTQKETLREKKTEPSSKVKRNQPREQLQVQNQQSNRPKEQYKNNVGNASDFFNKFSQNQPGQGHFEMLQSSIDHIQRDSSMISNQQGYFAQAQVKQKQIKMPKKKGKRDQIKEVDPSMFQ